MTPPFTNTIKLTEKYKTTHVFPAIQRYKILDHQTGINLNMLASHFSEISSQVGEGVPEQCHLWGIFMNNRWSGHALGCAAICVIIASLKCTWKLKQSRFL